MGESSDRVTIRGMKYKGSKKKFRNEPLVFSDKRNDLRNLKKLSENIQRSILKRVRVKRPFLMSIIVLKLLSYNHFSEKVYRCYLLY